jgi:hypothetical protein
MADQTSGEIKMTKWRFNRNSERGFAMLSTLICLVIASLIVAAGVGYVNTMFKARIAAGGYTDGLYAADAGVEDVLWCLQSSLSPRSTLPQILNNNQVAMQNQLLGTYTLYAGEWVSGSTHSDWLLVDSTIVWDGTAGAYKFTITITWNATGNTVIHLSEVGARLPVGYAYLAGSADDFPGNLSLNPPQDEVDLGGAHLLKWVFSNPYPSVRGTDRTKTQVFYITGDGDLEGYYSWVVAVRQDIGYVSEISGSVYRITATATRNGKVSVRIVADAMLSAGNVSILSWQSSRD